MRPGGAPARRRHRWPPQSLVRTAMRTHITAINPVLEPDAAAAIAAEI
jgi:hypothetical protein